jgi:K+ transporter
LSDQCGFSIDLFGVGWALQAHHIDCTCRCIVDIRTSALQALAPNYGIDYFLRNHKQGWVSLGGVVLAITGTEAFFADLGHFNVKAVRLSALAIVYPGLTCIYFGQAAFLIKRPDQIGTLYYNAIPHPLFWPAFVIALLAAIVASQAIITGTHSVSRGAVCWTLLLQQTTACVADCTASSPGLDDAHVYRMFAYA